MNPKFLLSRFLSAMFAAALAAAGLYSGPSRAENPEPQEFEAQLKMIRQQQASLQERLHELVVRGNAQPAEMAALLAAIETKNAQRSNVLQQRDAARGVPAGQSRGTSNLLDALPPKERTIVAERRQMGLELQKIHEANRHDGVALTKALATWHKDNAERVLHVEQLTGEVAAEARQRIAARAMHEQPEIDAPPRANALLQARRVRMRELQQLHEQSKHLSAEQRHALMMDWQQRNGAILDELSRGAEQEARQLLQNRRPPGATP